MNKRDAVTGNYYPVNDKSGIQIEDKKKGGKKWRIEIEFPKNNKKKRPRMTRTFYGSKTQAKNKTQELITYYDSKSRHIPRNIEFNDAAQITFQEYAEEWLRINYSTTELVRRSVEEYANMAKAHVFPMLGHIMLSEISTVHISRYKEIKLGELSPSTVNKHISFISSVLADAASDEKRMIQYNPAVMVQRARGSKKQNSIVNCLNTEELKDLLNKLESLYLLHKEQLKYSMKHTGRSELRHYHKEDLKALGYTDKEISSSKALYKFKASMLYPLAYLAAVTGMRLSELLALRWRDIDFDRKIILVYSSSHYGIKRSNEQSAHYINSTKEGKPKAYIDITDNDVDFLKQYRKDLLEKRMRYQGEYTDLDLVFPRKDGTYLRNDTASKEFNSFAKSIGYDITFHGLRHTHCTLLLAKGVPVMYVARRVGHQSPTTTNNIYSHVEKGDDLKLGRVFQEILSGSDFNPEELKEAEQNAEIISS